MLVSLKEIKKYVDLEGISTEEIASRLTYSGIEVEEIKKLASATNLVIGEIISCLPHPDSDHLHLCKVDVGSEILDIVCGAPNARQGLKVIVAKVGAKLPGGEIKKGEIRGQVSCGMMCALNELGVDPKSLTKAQIEGIEELPSDAKVGETDVLGYLGLDDEILDLSLLANRSDCYSLFNVAKEIGALFERKVTLPETIDESDYEEDFKVGSESDSCKSFYAKVVKGIEVKESPKWLKEVLRSENIKSINNIVDLGNYVMLLTGQPIHCYDFDKLENKELIVKDNLNVSFDALDDKTYDIKEGDLCVTSNNKIMCLGGIIGGKSSEIEDYTKNVVIEVANFSFAAIRKTANRLGLMTDSSMRFIKGINKDQSEEVINLFVKLLKEVSKVEKVSKFIKYDELNHDLKVVKCSKDYINNRLGSNFSFEEISKVLTLLHFEIKNIDDNNFECVVPSHRIDIDGKADLSEEIIRYYGFGTIKESLPIMETTVGVLSSNRVKERAIEDYLLNNGLDQVLSYTLINKKDASSFNYINLDENIVISNPLTEDHKYIRTNILSSVLRTAEYNLNHQNSDLSLFEISNVYSDNKEESHLAIVLTGNKYSIELLNPIKRDFFDMKGLFEGILNLFNIDSNRLKITRFESKEFHPGRSAKVVLDGKTLAVLGEIHPSIRNEYSLKNENAVLMEVNLSLLFNAKSGKNKFAEFTKFPTITRDIAFVVEDEIEFASIKKEIKKASSLIKKIEVFDIYKGEHVKEGSTSIAIRLYFESLTETLKENDITLVLNKVKDILISKFKADLRG